ncbi:MAG: acyl carrier protein, partial [Phycisphaerales bacterium]|nr:acyl carrier protein [Phycisphaerales bacterium]
MNSNEISAWIRERIAKDLGSEASAIDPEVTFDRIGLDSLALLGVLGDLASKLDIEIETSVLFDHPTISGLAVHLATA